MEKYEALILEVIDFGGEDVITSSGNIRSPIMPAYYDEEDEDA